MAKKDIRNFLLVLGSGVLVALLGVFWMVRVDGYERGLYVKEVLLSPETMEVLGKEQRYKVESIDYSYFRNGKWDMAPVERGPYGALWGAIMSDRGSAHPDPEIVKLFDDQRIATLAIYVRKEMPYQKEGLNELFQQMQIPSIGDYYRIQMHDSDVVGNWIYFYHPGIQKELSKVMHHG